MLGIEIQFLHKKEYIDHDGPYITDDDFSCLKYNDLKEYLTQSTENTIEISINEYFGSDGVGFDFNDCFSRVIIENVQNLNYFNENIFKISTVN